MHFAEGFPVPLCVHSVDTLDSHRVSGCFMTSELISTSKNYLQARITSSEELTNKETIYSYWVDLHNIGPLNSIIVLHFIRLEAVVVFYETMFNFCITVD